MEQVVMKGTQRTASWIKDDLVNDMKVHYCIYLRRLSKLNPYGVALPHGASSYATRSPVMSLPVILETASPIAPAQASSSAWSPAGSLLMYSSSKPYISSASAALAALLARVNNNASATPRPDPFLILQLDFHFFVVGFPILSKPNLLIIWRFF